MPRKSLKTVRVRGITKVTPAIDFLEFAKKLSVEEQKRAFFQRSAGTVQPGSPAEPLWSLAEQDGLLTGTVSFGSTRLKERALEAHGSQWGLDDEFDGLTVLHADEDAEVEYVTCLSIHATYIVGQCHPEEAGCAKSLCSAATSTNKS
jgi:hypothetical protein